MPGPSDITSRTRLAVRHVSTLHQGKPPHGTKGYDHPMSERPQVLAIGSCRVFRPLRPHHTDGSINLLNYLSHQWFTHSATGGQQFVEAITGQRDIPQTLRPLVCETALPLPSDLSGGEGFEPEVIFFEVSSLKVYASDDIVLNAHLLRSAMVKAGIDAVAGMRDPSAVDLASGGIPDVSLRQSSSEDFANAIHTVQQAFDAPIVLVNHLHALSADGTTQLSGRAEITEQLSRIADQDSRLAFFDTRDAIEELGATQALQDPQHYLPDAERAVGTKLLATAQSLL